MEQEGKKAKAALPADDESNFLCVQDTTAKPGVPRIHDIPVFDENGQVIDNVSVKCEYNSRTKVRKNIGLQFLKHKTFIVSTFSKDPAKDGRVLKPLELHEGGHGGLKLADNEIVANYDELSDEALFRRCHVLPSSESIEEESERADMIAFLKDARKKALATTSGIATPELLAKLNTDILGGGMTPSEISKLVTDSPLLQNRAA